MKTHTRGSMEYLSHFYAVDDIIVSVVFRYIFAAR